MKDLAPEILRQRMIIEGLCDTKITDEAIKKYLTQLSGILRMKALSEPVTHQSEKFGWAGWMHWETSGVHFYAWDEPRPFFSVDIYTCKAFSEEVATSFTQEFFNTTEIVSKNV